MPFPFFPGVRWCWESRLPHWKCKSSQSGWQDQSGLGNQRRARLFQTIVQITLSRTYNMWTYLWSTDMWSSCPHWSRLWGEMDPVRERWSTQQCPVSLGHSRSPGRGRRWLFLSKSVSRAERARRWEMPSTPAHEMEGFPGRYRVLCSQDWKRIC